MATRAPGRPRKGETSAPTDAQVLDAALDAFAERGFDGTSIRELGRRIGVSHNFLPQRFGSKQQLWYAAVDHGFSLIGIELLDEAGDFPDDDVGRLRATVARFIAANASRPALLRIITQEASSPGPRLDYLFDNYIEPVRVMGAGLLTELHEQGSVRTDSVALLYFFMTHGAGGPLSLPALAERFGNVVDPHDPVAVRRHADEAADVLFDGLLSAKR